MRLVGDRFLKRQMRSLVATAVALAHGQLADTTTGADIGGADLRASCMRGALRPVDLRAGVSLTASNKDAASRPPSDQRA